MRTLRAIGLALLFVCLAAANSAVAQVAAFGAAAPATPAIVGEPEPTYGTSSQTAFLITSVNFTPRLSSTPYFAGKGIERYITTVGAVLVAAPMLPNGARVERIELRACDTDASAEVVLTVGTCPTAGDFCNAAASVATGVAAMPGCTNFATNVAVPFPVNNQNIPILAHITTGTTEDASFSAVKIYYRLRVSPAPVSATFPNDVPANHPFFQFVEALVASGVTAGCAPFSFCPDTPVTRGQLAVFLAVALGLHFPG